MDIPIHAFNQIRIHNLQCGTKYELKSVCQNTLGSGKMSQAIETVTKGEKPKIPNGNEFITPFNDSVRLDLYRWNSETCPVSYFVVEYRKSQDHHWTLISNNLRLASRRFSIRHLTPTANYALRVRANNDAGSSEKIFNFQTAPEKFISKEQLGSSSDFGSNMDQSDSDDSTVYVLVPVGISLILILVLLILIIILIKKRKFYFIIVFSFFYTTAKKHFF